MTIVKLSGIRVWPMARFFCVAMAITGFIFGLLVTILSFVLPADYAALLSMGGYSAWSIVIVPIEYAIIGLILGVLEALIYNLVAHFIGGIEIELEQK